MNPLSRGIVFFIIPMMVMITLSCERLSLIRTDDSNESSSALLHQLSIMLDTEDNFFTDKALDLLNNVNAPYGIVNSKDKSFVYERKAVPGYDVLSLLITDSTTSITLKGQVTSQIEELKAERFFFDDGIKKIEHSFVAIKPDKKFEKQFDITRVNDTTGHPEPMLLRFKQVNGITRSIQILPVYDNDKASKHVYDYIGIGALGQDDKARYSRWERNVDVDVDVEKDTLQYTFTIYYDPDFISVDNTQMYEWALTSGFLRHKSLIYKRKITKTNEWTYKPQKFIIGIPQDNAKSKKENSEAELSEYSFSLKFEPLFIKELNIKKTGSSFSIPVLDGVLQYPPAVLNLFENVNKDTGITARVSKNEEKNLVTNDFAGVVKGNYLYSIYDGKRIVNLPDSLQGNEELLITPYTDPRQFTPDVTSRVVKRYKFQEGYKPTLNLYGSKVNITYNGVSVPLVNTPSLTGFTPFTSIYISEETASIILFYTAGVSPQSKDITFNSSVGDVGFDAEELTLTLSTGEGKKKYNVTVVANNASIKISDVSFDIALSQRRTNFGTDSKNVIIDDKNIVLILPHGLSVDNLSSKFAKVKVTVLLDDKPLHGVKLASDTISVNNTTSPPTFDVHSAVAKNGELITSKSNASELEIYLGDKKAQSVTYTILAGTIGLIEEEDDIKEDDDSNGKCFITPLQTPITEKSLETFIKKRLRLAYTIEGTETYIGDSKTASKVNKGDEIKGEIEISLSDERYSIIIRQGSTEKHYKIQTSDSGKHICF